MLDASLRTDLKRHNEEFYQLLVFPPSNRSCSWRMSARMDGDSGRWSDGPLNDGWVSLQQFKSHNQFENSRRATFRKMVEAPIIDWAHPFGKKLELCNLLLIGGSLALQPGSNFLKTLKTFHAVNVTKKKKRRKIGVRNGNVLHSNWRMCVRGGGTRLEQVSFGVWPHNKWDLANLKVKSNSKQRLSVLASSPVNP